MRRHAAVHLPSRLVPSLLAAVLAGLPLGCRRAQPGSLEVVGQFEGSDINEASGLAPSRSRGVYWVHNDSGGKPVLYAIDRRGRERGRLHLQTQRDLHEDWEDIASFKRDGKHFLLIADVGDNKAERSFVTLHALEEPDLTTLRPGRALELKPLWSQRVRYEKGARDCEAIAVDETGTRAYLLSKRDRPPILHLVNLGPEFADASAVAIGEVDGLPQPNALQEALPAPRGRYLGQPTALAFSEDGTWAAILTYGHVAVFVRGPGEPWAVSLSRKPTFLTQHTILQAEALCTIPGEKAILATGEGVGATLQRWRWQQPER